MSNVVLAVRGVVILWIWLQLCHWHGIDEVLINLHAHSSMVFDYLKGHKNGVHAEIVEEARLLGSAGTVWTNRDWANTTECFWILYADVLTHSDLTSIVRVHQSRGLPATIR